MDPYMSYFCVWGALKYRHKDILKYLLSKGAKVNHETPESLKVFEGLEIEFPWGKLSSQTKVEPTPLHLAVHLCDEEVMELLLQHGAWTDKVAGSTLTTPLCDAVQYNKTRMIEILLKHGANVNTPGIDGKTPLMIAAGKRGGVFVTKLLLDHGADPNSGLQSAAEGGKVEIMKLLLSRGADINLKSGRARSTFLHIATGNRHGQLVDFLLKNGADVNAVDSYHKSVLTTAVETGCPVIVNILLSHCPDLKKDGNKVAMQSALRCQSKTDVAYERHVYGEIIQSLLSYGFTIADKDANDPKSLFVAIRNGQAKIVAELIRRGSNRLKLRNSILSELLPLYPSTLANTTKLTNILIKYGADENARCAIGLMPTRRPLFKNLDLDIFKLLLTDRGAVKDEPDQLRLAVWHGQVEIVRCFLRHGADVNAQDASGRAALHFCVLGPKNPLCPISQRTRASVSVDIDIIKELVARGADLNVRTKMGDTPLHIAAQNNLDEVARVLVQLGADVNAIDDRGWTALHHCARNNNLKLSEYLLSRDAEVNARAGEGFTALHFACDRGRLDLVQSLLEHGADVDAVCVCGTPLHLACTEARNDVVKFLIEYGADVNITDRNDDPPAANAECGFGRIAGSSREILRSLLSRHFWKMVGADMRLSEKNLPFAERLYAPKKGLPWLGHGQHSVLPANFLRQCVTEVAAMKSQMLENSNFSCYDVLVGSTARLVKLSANENLRAIVTSSEFEQSFPIYASIIKRRYQKGKWMRELREKCTEILISVPPHLPHLCVDRILSYLPIFEMRRLVRASQST